MQEWKGRWFGVWGAGIRVQDLRIRSQGKIHCYTRYLVFKVE